MKILIVNRSDINGGAARAAYRLHKALLSQSVDSIMIVQDKQGDDFTVYSEKNKLQKLIDQLKPLLDSIPGRFYKAKTKFSPSQIPSSKLVETINTLNPDIVHLHWICSGMIRIEDLAKIKAPIVWSLHDMWAFTGGCHYDDSCGKYVESCGACPTLNSDAPKDLSSNIWKRKEKTYKKITNLTIIGLSRWLSECADNSSLFKNHHVLNLPNPIDTTVFKPIPVQTAREIWNLPQNKKLILFGAMGATSDPRKGFHELSDALKHLRIQNIELVIFGSSEPKNPINFGFPVHYIGSLSDDISLVALYNAVDVMIVPSLQENLSNAIMESLSCGTPVIAFNIGGNSDMIEHQKNGYLAKFMESTDLANGIDWALSTPIYKELSQNAREKVLSQFSYPVVAKMYLDLYRKILHDYQ